MQGEDTGRSQPARAVSGGGHDPWWRSAVVYQIYPRSFALGDPPGRARRLAAARPHRAVERPSDDATGDLAGIRERIEYLAWLGVDAIWLSPFQPSPMADYGYDVADYCGVDPLFGDLDAFDRLVADARDHGIGVMIDWVPNHSSDRHPWFVESRSSRDSAQRDWYWWRDGVDGGPPNNWRASFGAETRAWSLDEPTGQWYLHQFLPEQPDLNWENPAVAEAMEGTLRFWLDRGVAGFRIDALHCLGKDPTLADSPESFAWAPRAMFNDEPAVHPHIRRWRTLLDSYPGDPVMVGEVFLPILERIAAYFGDGDELHLSFAFPPLFNPWNAEPWRSSLGELERHLYAKGAWPALVLSNHDLPRHRTRFGGSEAVARAAAVLLLTLAGTPFLYQGEELGLENAHVPEDRRVDPGNRDPERAPIPWDASPSHGWPLPGEPWLPWPPEADLRNVERLRADPASILHLYRDLIALRRARPALAGGPIELLDGTPNGVLAYRRSGEDPCSVAINFSPAAVDIGHAAFAGQSVAIASDRAGEGASFGGMLAPHQAVVLA